MGELLQGKSTQQAKCTVVRDGCQRWSGEMQVPLFLLKFEHQLALPERQFEQAQHALEQRQLCDVHVLIEGWC